MTKTQYKRKPGYWSTEARKNYIRKWRENNRQRQREWFAEYRKNHREELNRNAAEYRARHKDEPEYKLKKNLRERLRAAMKGITKGKSTMLLVGCSVDELKIYLEKQFKPGMTWDNYGEWHIDHIIPCSKFDLLSLEAQMKCFHYTNLQPLWARENIIKGNRLTSNQVSTNI